MGERPLRQYYDGVTVVVDDDLGSLVEPWLRHRLRFTDELSGLTEAQWKAPTRCSNWDARGVVSHLVTVDSFFTMVLSAAQAGNPPTSFIRGFDPSTGTNDLVAPLLELPIETLLDQFVTGTDTLRATVESLHAEQWQSLGEAPFGHMPARLILAHALWDSWLHERDILQPLGLEPAVEEDELLVGTWYTLVVGGLQGGLIDDPEPVGPGADAPLDVTLAFDDLPGTRCACRSTPARTSRGPTTRMPCLPVRRSRSSRDSPAAAPMTALDALPADLADQLRRAAPIL